MTTRHLDPEAVLVDHPAVPVPASSDQGPEIVRPGETSGDIGATEVDRLRVAAQLAAVTCILVELDLWPGLGGLRNAWWSDRDGWPRAVLGALPRPLGPIWRRLGGGEQAAQSLASGARNAISAAAGLELPALPSVVASPGTGLERWLKALLDLLPRQLDMMTARALWAWQWAPPAPPEAGEIALLEVTDERAAVRLAAAAWLRLRQRGRRAWLWRCAPEVETFPMPGLGDPGTLVIAGDPTPEDLTAVDRWVDRHGAAALVLGRLPAGWNGAVIATPGAGDASRLRLVGNDPGRCRREVERRAGRFHPGVAADRQALTRAVAGRLVGTAVVTAAAGGEADGSVERLLALTPEGVPESFLAVHSGLSSRALARELADLGAVRIAGRWRHGDPRPMRRDPLHREAAALLVPDDPRRLVHQALAVGAAGELESWCRSRLDALDGGGVRALLADVAPGELGEAPQALLVEACLSELDVGGAREAVLGLPGERRAPFDDWLCCLDPPRDWKPPPVDGELVATCPRAALEIALKTMRSGRIESDRTRPALDELVAAALGGVSGDLRRWYELERVAVEQPDRIADRAWRRQLVSGNEVLARRLIHRWGLHLVDLGQSRAARRLLELAARNEPSPGRLGLILLDLASALQDEGRVSASETTNLRAFRLLTAAGFRHRFRSVVFNLAVADLDALRLERARSRLEASASRPDDPFVATERVRLELARGRGDAARTRLGDLELGPLARDQRFVEAVSFLEGAVELLTGDRRRAGKLLRAGGDEGRVWARLFEALRGAAPAEEGNGEEIKDSWGVGLAARLVTTLVRRGPGEAAGLLPSSDRLEAREALAVALVDRLLGRQMWIDTSWRSAAAARLAGAGMDGWARAMRPDAGVQEGLLTGLASLLEEGRPTALGEGRAGGLLDALGVTGLEARLVGRPAPVWRVGSGPTGEMVTWGGVSLLPFGGEITDSPAWRLLAAVLRDVAPEAAAEQSSDDAGVIGLHGVSAAMIGLRGELRQVAPAGVTVTLRGETGVGKELAARALHRLSGRTGRFVAVNVAAVPASLLEAELFGVVKGAFTGADRARRGLVQSADGGTLFLDEIGDLEMPLQAKLLRFLESREIRPVGSDQLVEVDVRIVTATHHDLEALRQSGRFRADLYYRIAGSTIMIPPLRERREDIPLLRQIFVERAVQRDGLRPARWAVRADDLLRSYDWPGNVRELRHVVEVALVRAQGGVVTPAELPIGEVAGTAPPSLSGTWEEAVAEFRRRLLRDTLRRTDGNRSQAARELGISRQTLLYHLRVLNVGKKG